MKISVVGRGIGVHKNLYLQNSYVKGFLGNNVVKFPGKLQGK